MNDFRFFFRVRWNQIEYPKSNRADRSNSRSRPARLDLGYLTYHQHSLVRRSLASISPSCQGDIRRSSLLISSARS